MAEASLSGTAAFEHQPEEARAGASAAAMSLHDQAEQLADDDSRGDLRVLVVLCAASAAMTLYTLYSIVSGLKLI